MIDVVDVLHDFLGVLSAIGADERYLEHKSTVARRSAVDRQAKTR
jgi:hypothetical protein